MFLVALTVAVVVWVLSDAIHGFKRGGRLSGHVAWVSVATGLYAAWVLRDIISSTTASATAAGSILGVGMGILLHKVSRRGAGIDR